MRIFRPFVLVALVWIQTAAAFEPIPMLGGRGLLYETKRLNSDRDIYQLGSEWGKIPVTQQTMAANSEVYRRAAFATARVNRATGFVLGIFEGEVVVATNHHVCPSAWQCMGSTVDIPWLGLRAAVQTFLGTWPDIDLALFTLNVTDARKREELAQVGRNFAWNAVLQPGQRMLSVGFGKGENPRREMVAVQDHDCVVFSGPGEYRKMGDPDVINPGTYQAWSFAHGCDVSHGDSGSAMVDRDTGDVLGIVWTGRMPKERRFQDSNALDALLAHPTEEVWDQLNYGVPATKMAEHLRNMVRSPSMPEGHRRLIQALLAN